MQDISPTVIRSLLGVAFSALKGLAIHSSPLSIDASSGVLSEPLPVDQRERYRIIRCLFLTII